MPALEKISCLHSVKIHTAVWAANLNLSTIIAGMENELPVNYLDSTQTLEISPPDRNRRRTGPGTRILLCCSFIAALLFAEPIDLRAAPVELPLPRFVSLKGSPANLRIGPGVQYDIEWVFVQRGIPLEIYQEYGNWRRVRDWEGTSGWIYGPLLSGRRTAVTAPWNRENIALRRKPTADSPVTAWIEPEVPVELVRCDGRWCRVAVDSIAGFVKQTRLWGAYPDEVL